MLGTGVPLTRKRTFEWVDSDFCPEDASRQTEFSLDSDLQILSVTQPVTPQQEKRCQLRNWCEEFAPTSSNQLAGNKGKITDLNKFLTHASQQSGPSILRLTGPPGSGKSSALRVLGQELGMEVMEWLGDTSAHTQLSELAPDDATHYQEGQLKKFQRFLLQCNYPKLVKICDASSANSEIENDVFNSFFEVQSLNTLPSSTKHPTKKLLIVNDLPNTFFCTPSLLHEVLNQYRHRGRQVLAFVTSSSQEPSDPYWQLFPTDVLRQTGVVTINFNSISHSGLWDVLYNVLLVKTSKVDEELLEHVLQISDGDVRFALNTLQFQLHSSTAPINTFANVLTTKKKSKSTGRGKKKVIRKPHQDNEQSHTARNYSLSSFHAIGKVLHSKRQPWTQDFVPASLPFHLTHHAREELLYQPDHVFESSGLSSDLFLGYVHKNAPEFFTDITELTTAYSYLSIADLLSPLSAPLFRIPCHYAPYVSSAGLSHSLIQRAPSKFKLLGPVDKQLRTTIADRKSTLREIAREISQIETDPFTLATSLLSYHQIISYHYTSPYVESLISSYRFANSLRYSRHEVPTNFSVVPSLFHSTHFSPIVAQSTEVRDKNLQTVTIDSFEDDDTW